MLFFDIENNRIQLLNMQTANRHVYEKISSKSLFLIVKNGITFKIYIHSKKIDKLLMASNPYIFWQR